jgi:hypothetical protein
MRSAALVLGKETLTMGVAAGFRALGSAVGREHLAIGVVAGLAASAQRTGGNVKMETGVSASMASDEAGDAYKYRNLGVHTQLDLVPEVRDSDGRLKWATDDAGRRG